TWSARQVRCGIAARSVTLAAAPDAALLAVCAGQPGMGFQAKSAAQSVNGGRSWAVHAPCPPAHLICRRAGPLDFGYLAQIAAVSPGTAFLVGGRSSLLVTTDGGGHWRTVRPPLGDTSGGTSQVIFVNRRDGFALGDDFRNGEAPTIWRTTDGGRRWSGGVPRPEAPPGTQAARGIVKPGNESPVRSGQLSSTARMIVRSSDASCSFSGSDRLALTNDSPMLNAGNSRSITPRPLGSRLTSTRRPSDSCARRRARPRFSSVFSTPVRVPLVTPASAARSLVCCSPQIHSTNSTVNAAQDRSSSASTLRSM